MRISKEMMETGFIFSIFHFKLINILINLLICGAELRIILCLQFAVGNFEMM